MAEQQAIKRGTRIGVLALVMLTSIGCDQYTKDLAQNTLQYEQPKAYANDMFYLLYTENSGVAFGMGQGLNEELRFWMFTVAVSVFLTIFLVHVILTPALSRLELLAFALVLGGGVGNVIDRLFNQGSVIDFMMIDVAGLRTGIFNFADVSIMIGFGLLLLTMWTKKPDPKSNDEVPTEEAERSNAKLAQEATPDSAADNKQAE